MKKIIMFLFLVLFSQNCYAVNLSKTDDLGEGLSYKKISESLNKIERQTKSKDINIDDLADIIPYLNEMDLKINAVRSPITEEIKLIEKRIEALGEVNENVAEAKIIAQKRQEYNLELLQEKTRLSEIDILSAKIAELNQRIFDIRNEMLWGNMLTTEMTLINPKSLLKANHELLSFGIDIIKSPYVWYKNLDKNQVQTAKNNIITIILIISFITVLGYFLRRLIITHFGYRSDIDTPKLGRKIIAAGAVWCAYGIIPTAIVVFCLHWLMQASLVQDSFLGIILHSALYYLLYIIIGRATCRVVFTPYNEKWRLIDMASDKAKRLTKAIYFTIWMVGIFAYMQNIVSVSKYPLELLSYILAVSASIKALCVAWISHIYFAETSTDNTIEESDDDTINEKEKNAYKIGMLVSVFTIAIIILSLFGYARLASFIVNRSLLTAVIIAVFSILRNFIYDAVQHILLMGLWVKTFRMRKVFLRKFDFWFGVIAEPLMLLVLIGAILVLWGVPFDVLKANVYKAISGFTIGGIKISLLSIMWSIIVFALCIWIIKMVRHRIEFKMLEKTNLDTGTKHSLASGFAYICYVLAGLLAIAVMGGDLTNIALIAGALSVGIGLGLQDIVNNFVSGIIMLFERPIKVGDWVVIGNEEGEVKQINIRSTEVQTFNRASVIIPNSQVLSNSVINRTHENNWARYSVKVGVAYGSDVEKVKELLLECASSHPKVSKKPAPYVLFQDFGDDSLDFEVRFYVSDINVGWTAPSDVRFIINKRFKEEGIEIPFKQMVVHQGSQIADRTENQFYAKKRGAKKNAN